MKLQARIKTLEKRFTQQPADRTPPVQFFDRIIDGTATPEEWTRWTPWLLANLLRDDHIHHSGGNDKQGNCGEVSKDWRRTGDESKPL